MLCVKQEIALYIVLTAIPLFQAGPPFLGIGQVFNTLTIIMAVLSGPACLRCKPEMHCARSSHIQDEQSQFD